MSRPACAFFDLDGTLLRDDTQWLFFKYIVRRDPARLLLTPLFASLAWLEPLGFMGKGELKRLFLSYLWRLTPEELDAAARDFVQQDVLPRLFPWVREELDRHRREGRILILNTASPEFYAREIAAALGFDHCFGTRIVVDGPMPLIPEMTGPNNKHEAKLPRMAALLPCDTENSWAYTDSAADLPLLSLAKNSVLVNPNSSLTAIGQAKGWKIVRGR